MRANEFIESQVKTLDPEIYGEELPFHTAKSIIHNVITSVDPQAKLKISHSPEGYYSVEGEKIRMDFGITADAGEISANLVNAFSSYKGAGVVTEILRQCFKAMADLYGQPTDFVISAHQDRGHGVWQAIAQKLGAKWGGSIYENFADKQYQIRPKEHVAEVGDSPAEYQPNRKRKRSLFHSTVDGHWVDVFFDRSEFNGTLHITFTVDGNYDTPTMPTKASKSIFKILSTVLNIVKKQLPEYMAKARPPALSFTAKEDNRAGLYRKYFVPVIQNILGDKWQLEEYPNMGMTVFNWKPKKKAVTEISTDTLQRYLGKADRHISRRLDHMSRARERLNKNYEIYDADLPGHPIVDRFEADTPAQAKEYYYDYIKNYVSDRDFTLELRRGTGIMEARLPRSVEDFLYNLTPEDVGVDEVGPYRIHYEGFTDDCQSSADYRKNPEAVYQQVFADHIAREGGRKPIEQNFTGDEDYPILYSVFKIPRQVKEAFDQPYRLTWEQGEYGSYDAYTQLPDGSNLSIHFNLESAGPYGTDEEWQVEFWRNNSLDVTGEGDAQRIFATVLAAIEDFIGMEHPERIAFSASKEVEPGQNVQSRAKLYDRLVQRYAASWGYRVARHESGDKVTYELSH